MSSVLKSENDSLKSSRQNVNVKFIKLKIKKADPGPHHALLSASGVVFNLRTAPDSGQIVRVFKLGQGVYYELRSPNAHTE